jgi:hypothetical protein
VKYITDSKTGFVMNGKKKLFLPVLIEYSAILILLCDILTDNRIFIKKAASVECSLSNHIEQAAMILICAQIRGA